MLLVCGGDADPNIQRFLEFASAAADCLPVLIGRERNPEVDWDLGRGLMRINGKPVDPASAFMRADVFGGFDDPRPEVGFRAYGWHTALDGFVRASSKVRIFNRKYDAGFSKPVQLSVARRLGLRTPATLITNSESSLKAARGDCVVKPINGGDYCQELPEVIARTNFRSGRAATPAIVQERLRGPDLRVFRVGCEFMAFRLRSSVLDYRTSSEVQVTVAKLPNETLLRCLERLTDAAGLNFAAADFKRAPDSNEWVFLEVNSGPMFAAFDVAAKGALITKMIQYLVR